MSDRRIIAMFIGGVLLLVFIFSYLTILPFQMEANSFNKFTTGAKATWWDAVWVDLKVTSQ